MSCSSTNDSTTATTTNTNTNDNPNYESNAALLRECFLERQRRRQTDVSVANLPKTDVPPQKTDVSPQKTDVSPPNKPRFYMTFDLTDDTNWVPGPEPEEQAEEVKPRKKRKQRNPTARALPTQDVEFLQEAEEEYFEVIPKKTSSIDRKDRKRGCSPDNAIIVDIYEHDHFICDCPTKCVNRYTCLINGHVQCKEMIKQSKKTTTLYNECFICGSIVL